MSIKSDKIQQTQLRWANTTNETRVRLLSEMGTPAHFSDKTWEKLPKSVQDKLVEVL
jgi:hypothetical protein